MSISLNISIVLEIPERRGESVCRVRRNLGIIGLMSRDRHILASTHSIQRSKRRQQMPITILKKNDKKKQLRILMKGLSHYHSDLICDDDNI
jgi:hypothetical protein